MELGTVRPQGMGVSQIPITAIWQYIDRYSLPDYWEPILLQVDADIVHSANEESDKNGQAATNAINTAIPKQLNNRASG